MMNVSSEFRSLVKSGVKLVNYADITLKDGTVLNLGPSDFSVGGFSMTDKTSNGKFEIGTAIAKTITVTIANHTNKFSDYDFYRAIIYMYIAIEKSDGTVLKERKGKYYVINPATPGDTIKLSGVDSMHLFDKPFNSDLPFPATLHALLSACCTDCGVNIGFGKFANWNFEIKARPEDCTYREVVSWIAQIAGYNARISNNDYLELVWYDTSLFDVDSVDGGNFILYEESENYDGGDFSFNTGDVLDGGNFTDQRAENVTRVNSLSVSTDDVVITGVKVEFGNVVAIAGTEEYVISIKDNPLTESKEQEIADMLFARVGGLRTRPMSCQIPNNPLWEPFDVCVVYDRKGNGYNALINSVTFSISGFTTIACNADDPVRNESSYTSEAAKAVVQARKNTERQLTLYGNAVQNMNDLAANAMGLYRESETLSDGSVIYYMSNRPIVKNEDGTCEFELDSVVYKMTGDGFFVSEDGGLSYTSGFDAQGNAIVNVLSAIGINFDWARGGTLSLGGFDNMNGVINIFDATGAQVGVIDNNGLAFFSNETQLQVIISPSVGIVQRDADGNEYYGYVFDKTIQLPKYNDYAKREVYTGVDEDTIQSEVLDSKFIDNVYYAKYRYYYVHQTAYWNTEPSISYPTGNTSITIQLPEKFKGKKWIVRLVYGGMIDKSGHELKCHWNYGSLPYCKEGLEVVGSEYVSGYGGDMDSYYKLLFMTSTKQTPYLKYPEVTSGEYDISYDIPDEISDYSFDYVEDTENGTITITGKAMAGNYCVNELMNIRVLVSC